MPKLDHLNLNLDGKGEERYDLEDSSKYTKPEDGIPNEDMNETASKALDSFSLKEGYGGEKYPEYSVHNYAVKVTVDPSGFKAENTRTNMHTMYGSTDIVHNVQGQEKRFQFPNNNGTLALTSDIPTEEVESLKNSLNDTEFLGYDIPSEMPIQNYRDSNRVYHQRVGRVDLGSLNWKTEGDLFAVSVTGKKLGDKNLYTTKYSNANNTSVIQDKQICGRYNNDYIFVKDTTYTDTTAFKSAMQGVYLYYELATEKTYKEGEEIIFRILNGTANLSDYSES